MSTYDKIPSLTPIVIINISTLTIILIMMGNGIGRGGKNSFIALVSCSDHLMNSEFQPSGNNSSDMAGTATSVDQWSYMPRTFSLLLITYQVPGYPFKAQALLLDYKENWAERTEERHRRQSGGSWTNIHHQARYTSVLLYYCTLASALLGEHYCALMFTCTL